MEKLKIALCQFDIQWNCPMANHSLIEELIAEINFDILILPEMFDTGFVTEPKILKDQSAIRTKKWMQEHSHKGLILGSLAQKVENSYQNILYAYDQGRELTRYVKSHTFIGGERSSYESGRSLGILDYKGWKLGLNICYDLRFPVWCHAQKADILVFVANWPEKRASHWYSLLKARAIENQCFVMGVNRVGHDENGLNYIGQSVIFDYKGEEIVNLQNKETAYSVVIEKQEMMEYRSNLPFLLDRDEFELKM